MILDDGFLFAPKKVFHEAHLLPVWRALAVYRNRDVLPSMLVPSGANAVARITEDLQLAAARTLHDEEAIMPLLWRGRPRTLTNATSLQPFRQSGPHRSVLKSTWMTFDGGSGLFDSRHFAQASS